MRKLLMLAALLVPMASQAQVQLGLRVGYAPAMGEAEKDFKMSDGLKSQIPLQLDALYKVTKDIGVGAYFAYGFGQVDITDVCEDGVDCSGNVMRFGVQGHYTFNQLKSPLVPWAGLGFGYEIGKAKAEQGSQSIEVTYSGFEFLNLQVGGDYRVNEKFAVGPYLQFSLAQYSKFDFKDNTDLQEFGGDEDGDVEEKSMHEWFGFGIRGTFDL
jgi:hypothetical protein